MRAASFAVEGQREGRCAASDRLRGRATARTTRHILRPPQIVHQAVIVCRGDTLRALVNGQQVQFVKGLVHNVGRLGLRVERGATEFRNIQLQQEAKPEPQRIAGVALAGDDGVTLPVVEHEVKPEYTRKALAVGVQGEVWLKCVVLANGAVGDVIVLRSLRSDLDANAINAARQWRFKPATRNGQPVPVMVTLEMTFIAR